MCLTSEIIKGDDNIIPSNFKVLLSKYSTIFRFQIKYTFAKLYVIFVFILEKLYPICPFALLSEVYTLKYGLIVSFINSVVIM